MSFIDITLELLAGFGYTLALFFLTLVLAIPLGMLIAFCRMSNCKPVQNITKIFIWIIRGIPLMLLIFMIYYLPGLLGVTNVFHNVDIYFTSLLKSNEVVKIGSFIAVLIAFVINYACYFAEIFRGGIQSISHGQYEAGQVLGLTKTEVFFKIVLLQVIKRIIPPMSNEIITLIKDTSLANTIVVCELIFEAKEFMLSGLIWPLFVAGAFYLIFVGLLTILFGRIEKKLDYFKA